MRELTWRLTIHTRDGLCGAICGTEEVLRTSRDEIRDAITATDGTGPKLVTVLGYSDTADRADQEFTVLVESVLTLSLNRLY